jgi:proton glutamate symport protein
MLKLLRRMNLSRWIIVAMILGVLIGWTCPEFSQKLAVIAEIFLRMIKSIIAPLLFGTLVVGIAGHGDNLKSVGRLALRSVIYFEVITTLALVIGLFAVNLARPGDGVSLGTSASEVEQYAAKTPTVQGVIEHMVPSSFAAAAANNDLLQVVFFTVLFAVALSQVRGKAKATMLGFCEALTEVMFKFTGIVMLFAPFGIGAAIASTVGRSGLPVMLNLGKLILTFYIALAAFVVLVLLPVMWAFGIPIRKFFRAIREPALVAFSTTCSEAALPQALERMREFGVPNRIVSFVLPTGYSFNLDGSALYLGIASIFIAQAAHIEMDLPAQLLMLLTLMLASKGCAGVARSSLVVLSGMAVAFGLPLEGVAVLLAVDPILDVARATLNLVGNCLAAAVMARWEGELIDLPVPDCIDPLESGLETASGVDCTARP